MVLPKLTADQEALARRIHEEAIIVDSLTGSISSPKAAIEAGLSAVHLTMAIGTDDFQKMLRAINQQLSVLDYYREQTLQVTSVDDIERAKRERKIGLILGFQGARWMGDQLELLPIVHRLGIRIGIPVYMEGNLLGDGCLEPENRRLTSLGTQFVDEMNRLGMLIDLSHAGYAVCEDVLARSRVPVALTHSNSRSLCDSPRNVPDSIIKAVGAAGGYIGVSPYSAIVGKVENGRPQMEDFLRHLDHVVELVGPDHVGIGTDFFDGSTALSYMTGAHRHYPDTLSFAFGDRHVTGFENIARWPQVTQTLVAQGYPESAIRGILGGNFLRLLRAVWRT